MSRKPGPGSQPMPMDRAILWNPPAAPGARPSGRAPYPIFVQQEAVVALQEHLKSSPTQAIFGFLIGDLFRDPDTGVLYAVIDKTLKLSQAIYSDKTEVVVSRLWDRMQQQLAKAAGSLLGWRSEEHTSELQSPCNLVCRLLLEKKTYTPSRRPALARCPLAPWTHARPSPPSAHPLEAR